MGDLQGPLEICFCWVTLGTSFFSLGLSPLSNSFGRAPSLEVGGTSFQSQRRVPRLGLTGSTRSQGAADEPAEVETALGPGPAGSCSHGARELCGSPGSGGSMEKLSRALGEEGRGGCGSQRLHRSCTEAPRLGGGESRPYLFMIRPLAFALACTFCKRHLRETRMRAWPAADAL